MKIRLRIQGDGQSRDFAQSGTPVTIGRSPTATIVLEENAPTSVVSWDHARIDPGPGDATVTDLRSSNGTYRNNERVVGTAQLRPGDVLRLGTSGPVLTVMLIDLTPEPVARPAKPAVRAAAAPAVVAAPVVVKPARPKATASPPLVSETRGIAMQAVQELKSQRAANARQKYALVVVSCVGLLMAVLLALGFWTQWDRIAQVIWTSQKNERDIAETKGELEQLGRTVRAKAQGTADHFARIEYTLESQRRSEYERDRKLEVISKQQIDQAAQLRGGIDKLKQEFGASLDDINGRLVKAPPRRRRRGTGHPRGSSQA